MDNDTDAHAPAINQANTDGKIFWDQVNGRFLIKVVDINGVVDTLTIGVLDTGELGVQIIDSNGVILFDAFQSAFAIVSNSNKSGDFTDIQMAINVVNAFGGGEVFIKNGTYLLNADITLYDNITIKGETSGGVILDFQNQPYQIISAGSLTDNTGTVSIANNSTSVVGVGTAFDSSWVGQQILLYGFWFTIASVTNANNLEVELAFDADDLNNYGTIIGTPISGVTISTLTVQNSLHADGAIYFNYSSACFVDNIYVITSTIGINWNAASTNSASSFLTIVCGIGFQATNSSTWTINDFETYASTSDNISCTNAVNGSFSNATISLAGGNNLTFLDCENWSIYDITFTTSVGSGLYLTGCRNLQISSLTIRDSGSDAITFNSNNSLNVISGISCYNNQAYSINIVDNTNVENIISNNLFTGSGIAPIQNLGLQTLYKNNLPANSHQLIETTNGTPSINTNIYDYYELTALSEAITSFTTGLSGSPFDNQLLWISITDNGTPRAITWGASFEASTLTLPTTTTASTRLDLGFTYNSVTSKWRLVAKA